MTEKNDAASNSLPLEGIRVLELGNFIAAPFAARIFGDFGAEVIKIERPGGGDELRDWLKTRGETSLAGTRSRSSWICARPRARMPSAKSPPTAML